MPLRRAGGLTLLAWVALCLPGCEFIVRFDRDRIVDSGVRLDGEVVQSDP